MYINRRPSVPKAVVPRGRWAGTTPARAGRPRDPRACVALLPWGSCCRDPPMKRASNAPHRPATSCGSAWVSAWPWPLPGAQSCFLFWF